MIWLYCKGVGHEPGGPFLGRAGRRSEYGAGQEGWQHHQYLKRVRHGSLRG